ncbi:hypothetical protein HF086_009670 [Spodoptera exigua]|uniref:Phospholipase B-like n=1 Tax=Spodoptera exigua TaxID=7107 RepID=A0A922MTA3_SPOEX|nr:hypothetical protein HF086_009670 [Spodoptera exigua]
MNPSWCVLLVASLCTICECKYGYVVWDGNKVTVKTSEYFADIPDGYVARATYSNEINSTGWAFLELHSSRDFSDEKQAYAAGYLEGFLTRDLIWMHWQNMLKGYCYNKTDVCGLIEEFVDKNEEYMSSMVETNSNNSYCWINMLGDLDELAFALSLPKSNPENRLFDEHCTGLVKLLPDHSNLYVSHVTWNSYQSMLRLHKMYVMYLHVLPGGKKIIPGYKMSLTSYPAFVQSHKITRQSTDDFYIISSGLTAGETTIGNSNRSLFEHVKPVGQILEYARAMVANRLARTGKQWVDIFSRHNSGTYNNQWTEHLTRTTYFPSYNIPYFPRIFNLSGGNVRTATFGDWFGYDTNPRAKILKQKQVTLCFSSMLDFTTDAIHGGWYAADTYQCIYLLLAGTFPFRALGHRSHGATDAKITSAYLRGSYRFLAIASPTHNISRGIPPFRWSKFDMGPYLSHVGHPDEWMFPPILHDWEWE